MNAFLLTEICSALKHATDIFTLKTILLTPAIS